MFGTNFFYEATDKQWKIQWKKKKKKKSRIIAFLSQRLSWHGDLAHWPIWFVVCLTRTVNAAFLSQKPLVCHLPTRTSDATFFSQKLLVCYIPNRTFDAAFLSQKLKCLTETYFLRCSTLNVWPKTYFWRCITWYVSLKLIFDGV